MTICVCGKELRRETWAVDDRGSAYTHWIHRDSEDEICIPNEESKKEIMTDAEIHKSDEQVLQDLKVKLP